MINDLSKLKKKYISLGLKKGQNLYITSDFKRMINKKNYKEILANHFNVIKSIIGSSGTIIVPTATTHLCNTKKVFDLKNTPSRNMGVFSEYVRKKIGSKRSMHPIWSVSAIGKLSNYFTKNISKHSFGHDSIWTRLINKNAWSLHIDIDPRKSLSIIHYDEFMVGVPHRFTKEFNQFVRLNDKKKMIKFYHFCLFSEKKLIKDGNKKIFKNFIKFYKPRKIFLEKKISLTLLPLKKFHNINLFYLNRNRKAWLK